MEVLSSQMTLSCIQLTNKNPWPVQTSLCTLTAVPLHEHIFICRKASKKVSLSSQTCYVKKRKWSWITIRSIIVSTFPGCPCPWSSVLFFEKWAWPARAAGGLSDLPTFSALLLFGKLLGYLQTQEIHWKQNKTKQKILCFGSQAELIININQY